MADNTTLNQVSGTPGDKIATKDVTHGGEAAKLQAVGLMGVSGTEGSYTIADINGDAANGLDVDVTRLPTLPTGDNNIGNVDIVTVPADPFGANADAASASGSISAKLRQIATNGVPVTNAGTFATQESGGALTALQIIDDWDEADRAKVNPIVGQAGVAAGAGAVSATVQRTTLASDDPAVTALQLIDNLVLTEDAAHSSGEPGILGLAVRRDADTSLVDTDGDRAPLQVNASGSLKVAITSGAGSGGTAMADDAAFTPGTTSITPMGAMFDDVTPDSVNEGDGGVVRMSANRNLYTTIRDAAGNERGLNVDANGAVAIGSIVPGTGATNMGKAVDAVAGATDTGIPALAIRDDALTTLTPADGDYVPLRVSSTGALHVTGGGGGTQYAEDAAHVSGDTGTMALAVRKDSAAAIAGTDGDYTPLQTDSTGRLRVTVDAGAVAGIVDDAAFTPGTTEGVMLFAEADDTTPDAVDEGDAGALRMSLNRNLYTQIRDAAGNERGANVNASGQLNVTGPVTNAGTFAVQESGGALTALQIIDDWDETDRCKVNPIAGQAGVAAGAGAVGATVQRMTLASDDPAVVALQLIDNPVVVDDAAFTPATTSVMMAGFEFDDTTPDSVNEGDAGAARMSANRCQYVMIRDNAGNERGLNIDASGFLTANINGTVTVGSHAVTNAGTFATQVDGAALTALQLIDNPVLVDDAAFTPATSSVMMSGFQADETSTDSVDEGDAGAARMTLDRKVIVTAQPHTKGGLSIFRSLDLDESEEEVKASAGQVYGAWVCNTHTATLYLKFYNATAANVTVGTTTPVITIPIPGNSADDISAILGCGGLGIEFDTAITVAVTTGLADNDTGAPAANAFICNLFYK